MLRYVKNDHLGFEVPYVFKGQEHRYRPDFIAVVDDRQGADDPLSLVLEVKASAMRRMTPSTTQCDECGCQQ